VPWDCLPALTVSIRQTQKPCQGTNTQAFSSVISVTKKNSFICLPEVSIHIELLTRMFVPRKHFLNISFKRKAIAYTSGVPYSALGLSPSLDCQL
jgi:hypothetical protein